MESGREFDRARKLNGVDESLCEAVSADRGRIRGEGPQVSNTVGP